MLRVVRSEVVGEVGGSLQTLDELAREGARRMLMEALEVEVAEYIETHRGQRDEAGHALVVRNGHARERKVTTGAGTFPVKAPRVNDRRAPRPQHQDAPVDLGPQADHLAPIGDPQPERPPFRVEEPAVHRQHRARLLAQRGRRPRLPRPRHDHVRAKRLQIEPKQLDRSGVDAQVLETLRKQAKRVKIEY